MSEKSEPSRVELTFDGKGVGKMRNEIEVTGTFGGSWDFATDEGDFHGGEGTAPPPLAYFAAGVASCFMTQVRAFSKRLDVQLDRVAVTGSVAWWLHLDGRRPYTSSPAEFRIVLDCDSPNSAGELWELVAAAERGCFVEAALSNEVKIHHDLILNGEGATA